MEEEAVAAEKEDEEEEEEEEEDAVAAGEEEEVGEASELELLEFALIGTGGSGLLMLSLPLRVRNPKG